MRRQGNRNALARRAALALLLGFCVLSANRAEAEGSALVIGIGTYAGQPTLARCVRTARISAAPASSSATFPTRACKPPICKA